MSALEAGTLPAQTSLFPDTGILELESGARRSGHDAPQGWAEINNSLVGQTLRFRKMIAALEADGGFSKTDLLHAARVLYQLEPAVREGIRPALPDEILAQHQQRPAGEDERYRAFGIDAKVPHCRECGGKCCKVHPSTSDGNLIVMAPCEWDAAQGSGIDMRHLKIERRTDVGMLHVSCANSLDGCTGCGPNASMEKGPGIKPWDCVFYPWLPIIGARDELEMWVADNRVAGPKAPKCIAPGDAKLAHLPAVVARFTAMLSAKPEFRDTYTNAIEGMVGYRRFDPSSLQRLSPTAIQKMLSTGMELTLKEARERLVNSGATESDIELIMRQYTRDLGRKASVACSLVGNFFYASNPSGTSPGWADARNIA